jgi:predicted nucleic acid-binding protein
VNRPKVFVDSDVIISSLISTKGAAYLLLSEQESNFIISDLSRVELERVVRELNLNQDMLQDLIKKRLKTIKLTTDLEKISKDFQNYTSDVNDIHIVAGAAKAKVRFLLTYNIKHFHRQKIKENLGIIVLTPAQYLQYLRSLD